MTRRPSFCKELIERIEAKAFELGSQSEVARLAGMPRYRLNRFVNGVGKLNNDDMDRLFEVLGLTICEKQKERNR